MTARLLEFQPLMGLINQSTPYRIKVPTREALNEYYPVRDSESYQTWNERLNPAKWPVVELDPTQMSLMSSTMKANQRILQRSWKLGEIRWILNQSKLVTKIALESRVKDQELGIGTAVSSYSLDPPEEIAHLIVSNRACCTSDEDLEGHDDIPVENPILMAATDVRLSSSNALRHSVVELAHSVSNLDRQQARKPQSELHPIPYLLTNQVVFSTHEPCLLCSMALLHSRIKHLFFLIPSPGSGGCGSVYNIHEQEGLNHKFFVWRLKIPHSSTRSLVNNFFDA